MATTEYREDDANATQKLLRDGKRFVAWREELRRRKDGTRTPTKVPYSPGEGRAESDKPATWGTREEAARRAETLLKAGRKGGVGIMLGDLGDGRHLCGVDLDSCFDDADLHPWAFEIVAEFGTLAEHSPGGAGLKLYFLASTADVTAARKFMDSPHRKTFSRGSHCEVALDLGGRFYALTDRLYEVPLVGSRTALASVPLSKLRWLLTEAGPAFAGATKGDGRDESGSGYGIRFMIQCALKGMAFDAALDAMRADTGPTGEWVARTSDRELKRTWAKAEKRAGELRDDERMLGLFTDDMVDGSPYDPPPVGYALDEDGIIRAFTDRYSGRLRFDHDLARWFTFDGWWRPERTKLALAYARETSTELAKRDAKAKGLKSVKAWEAVERGARSVREFAVTSDVWNRDPMLLGTPGGVLDLRTGKLRRGMPGDYISKVTAVAPGGECPTWLAFLDDALQRDAGAIRLLQQWGGYSLTGETKEQKLVFVYGPGGSGKGTAINTIAEIMGDYAVNVGMETLTARKHEAHTTELARLRGARMARASETEKGKAWAENRIKTLTGQDTVTARFMRQDDFEFRPEFKLTIFGNSRPSLRDVDAAIRRRFIVLPFTHKPAKPDPDLGKNLKAEWPGILSWLIAGCLDWQRHGLVIPEVARAATDAYFDEQDVFGQWLGERCEVGPQYAETTDVLWSSWSRYAYGLGEEPGSKTRTFPETLSQHGFTAAEKIGPSRGRGYRGVRLRPVETEADERFG